MGCGIIFTKAFLWIWLPRDWEFKYRKVGDYVWE